MEERVHSNFHILVFTHMIIFYYFQQQVMKAEQIRQKYKQILEEPEDDQDSEDEWEIAYSQMAKQRKKRILTQSSPNKSCIENLDHQNTLAIKQKLAQCISNNKSLERQIERLKKANILHADEKIEWQETIAEMDKTIEEQRIAHQHQLYKNTELQTVIAQLNRKLEQVGMDRDLQQKQVEYYQTELKQSKDHLQKQEREFKSFNRDYKQFEKVRKENQYLKRDVERLSMLIEDCLKAGRVSGECMRRHFLGRPHRQFDYWFPQQLIGQVDHFLKKSQVGYGNKQFTSSLVKFIDKYTDRAVKQSEANKGKTVNVNITKSKDGLSLKKPAKVVAYTSSFKKHSYNLSTSSNVRQESNLKSVTSCFWKSNQSRVTTLNRSLTQSNLNKTDICLDILNEFKAIVFQLLLEKQIKRKKIKRLIDSMSNSIIELMEEAYNDKQSLPSHKNVFGPIRLETNDSTDLLK